MRLIESNLNQGAKVILALHCEMLRVVPHTEDITTTCYFNSNLKTIVRNDIISEEYTVMSNEILENTVRPNKKETRKSS